MILLHKINEENFEEYINPNVTIVKNEFVDSVSYSLSEAWLYLFH